MAAAEIKVLSPVALKPVLAAVGAEFERSRGHTLAIAWGESGTIKTDIENGVAFDVAILTPSFADDLARQSKLDGGATTPIARSGIGIAIRHGAPKPDVGTTDAFKRTLLDAKSIGFVEHSASSRYLNELLARLGIADAVKAKLKPLPGPAAEFVGNGDPELAITQIGAIVPFPAIELAGALPAEIQRYTVFVAVAPPNASAAARAFIQALASPFATSILRQTGLEPPA